MNSRLALIAIAALAFPASAFAEDQSVAVKQPAERQIAMLDAQQDDEQLSNVDVDVYKAHRKILHSIRQTHLTLVRSLTYPGTIGPARFQCEAQPVAWWRDVDPDAALPPGQCGY